MKGTWIGIGMIVALLGGCRFNDQQTKLQYMPDMADAPTVKSQESYIDPPDGTVALTTIDQQHQIYPATVEEADSLEMPESVANDPDGVLKGKEHYATFCAVCHAADGRSQNVIVSQWMAPTDLTSEMIRNRTNGNLFYRITFGTAVMPGYGHSIEIDERWQIVRYMRELQSGH